MNRSATHRAGGTTSIVAAAMLSMVATPLAGQGTWDAILAVDPVPSPYLSDWEANRTYGTLTVFNGSGQTQSVRLAFTVVDRRGRVLASGRSDPQLVPAEAPAIFDDPFEIAGSTTHDAEVEAQMRRTGRLPEGEYRACVAVLDLSGFQLAEACESFSVVYPDPPYLVAPYDGEIMSTQDFFFQWTPSQVPVGFELQYVLEVAEVRQGQLAAEALRSNILHFHDPGVVGTVFQYPLDAQPLVAGRRYAWRVRALDVNGYPVAANDGSSQIWTFIYRGSDDDAVVTSVALASRRETLRNAGDTVRFVATAYDQYDLEIIDRPFRWRAGDTTVARVDDAGLVTWVGGAQETRIVVSLDDVSDSALVTAGAGGLSIRFAQYDAEAEQPTLLELIQSGSYDDVVPRLNEMLETGEFVIPIPRFPGTGGTGDADGGEGAPEDGFGASGPSAPEWIARDARRARPADECSEVVVGGVSPHLDPARKVFALSIGGATEVAGCVPHVGADGDTVMTPDTTFHNSMVFVVSWEHPGLPRVFLAVKGIGGLPLPLAGTEVRLRYIVLNFLRGVTVESDVLPASLAGFFGDESFSAGVGLTIYSKRRCANGTATHLCRLLAWINEDNPDLTVQAFLGVTASETSVGGGTGGLGVGTSTALGFSIQASLPVRTYDLDVLGVSLDSTQVGLLFSVQDSIVNDNVEASGGNWSVGLSPTLVVWWSVEGGNSWEFVGSIGIEIDPTNPTDRPKLVVSGQIPAVWKLWWVRLGNPAVVFTKQLEAGGEVTLGLSGTWGFGPWDGTAAEAVGVDGGGGGHRGDAGGAPIGGVTGFEELGRGAVVFKWERSTPDTAAIPRSPTDASRALAALNDATELVNRLERLEREATPGCEASGDSASEACRMQRSYAAQLANAELDYRQARDAYFAIRRSQVSGPLPLDQPSRPGPVQGPQLPTCSKGTLVFNRTRCFSWSARLSMGNGGLLDLLALAVRAGTGTQ